MIIIAVGLILVSSTTNLPDRPLGVQTADWWDVEHDTSISKSGLDSGLWASYIIAQIQQDRGREDEEAATLAFVHAIVLHQNSINTMLT